MRRGQKHEPLFVRAKAATGKERTTLITDALGSYKMARELDFPHTKHVRKIAIAGEVHNSKMERMNGEISDRERVMRGKED